MAEESNINDVQSTVVTDEERELAAISLDEFNK